SGKVIGVNSLPPEIGILEVITRVISKHSLDVVADECGPERSSRLESVDHGGRRTQQPRYTLLYCCLHCRLVLARLICGEGRTEIAAAAAAGCLGRCDAHASL